MGSRESPIGAKAAVGEKQSTEKQENKTENKPASQTTVPNTMDSGSLNESPGREIFGIKRELYIRVKKEENRAKRVAKSEGRKKGVFLKREVGGGVKYKKEEKREKAEAMSKELTQSSSPSQNDTISFSRPSGSMMTGEERIKNRSRSTESEDVWSEIVTGTLENLKSPISRSTEGRSEECRRFPLLIPYGNPVSSGGPSLLTRTDASSFSSDSCAPVATSKASGYANRSVFTCTVDSADLREEETKKEKKNPSILPGIMQLKAPKILPGVV